MELPSRCTHVMASFGDSTWPWVVLLLVAVGVYVLGLGGQYVPTNGDEMVYAHIARLTAASGHWLPLVSDIDHMRNTKPPLLFWQAMVAGSHHWNMVALRFPSVLYTLLIASAIGLTLHRITLDVRQALMAACIYLAFYCTFRFGRTYLTSAPETFWLGLPMFVLLWFHNRSLGWLAHIGLGCAMGIGLAYKSFALVVPAAATLWLAQITAMPPVNWKNSFEVSLKTLTSALIALGIFGLWFVLDPNPSAVWQEFVINENAGKMNNSAGYWHTALLGGGFSIWAQGLGYVQNAGLLAFVVLGFMVFGLHQSLYAWRFKTALIPRHVTLLLIWLGIWLLVFILPSQRSARYLIPAMPALAMLLTIYWQRIPRGWFVLSLLMCSFMIGLFGRIAWVADDLGIGNRAQFIMTELAVMIGFMLVFWGVVRVNQTRQCTVAATLVTFGVFGLTTAPFDGPSGTYSMTSQIAVQKKRIAVPSNFNGQFERFEFLLPGNQLLPYDTEKQANNAQDLQRLLATHDAVVWLQTRHESTKPPGTLGCRTLGERWVIKGRHRDDEITLSNLWQPEQWLFQREWLISTL